MNYQKIKQLIELKNITLREICQEVDITEQGFHQMIRKRSMKIEILEKISTFLGVPVSYFFDDKEELDKKNINVNGVMQIGSKNSNNNDNANKELELCKKEIDYLKKQVHDKEEIIELLKGRK